MIGSLGSGKSSAARHGSCFRNWLRRLPAVRPVRMDSVGGGSRASSEDGRFAYIDIAIASNAAASTRTAPRIVW